MIYILILSGIVIICCTIAGVYNSMRLRKLYKLLDNLKDDRKRYLDTGKM